MKVRRAASWIQIWKELIFQAVCLLILMASLIALVALLADVYADGFSRLSWDFVTGFPSRFPHRAGILPALLGTIYIMLLTVLLAFPVGVGAAIYFEEYASVEHTRFSQLVEINIANLAAVPSIIYGLLGLAIFVRMLSLGQSLLAGALTLALLVLPVIIIASREALRAVPASLREASFALGATRWQTIRRQVLPLAFPGILTGTILALSRAIGETAPLITIGALTYVAFIPEGLFSPFTVLPIQIFNWISRPQAEFHANAAAAIGVLLPLLFLMNGGAIWLRNRFQKRLR
ncbi:MAG: phosphate ABC transporter permease PstA [Acidobacteria bacterium]|nr:phosphate ABC transporter permease PstA [Acidobacteriota bacterium]